MNKKYFLFLFMFIVFVSFASANLGVVKQGDCINIRVLSNCSSINISEVTNFNETIFLNKAMNNSAGQSRQTFNYTFCATEIIGTYAFSWDNHCKDCSVDGCGNTFEVTYDGNIPSLQRSILSLGLIGILFFMFILIIFNIDKLPSKNNQSEEGIILDVNHLKYLRPVLWASSWGLLLGIVFLTFNISIAHLPNTMFATFFFMLYQTMFIMTLPMAIVWFVFIIASLFRDKELKEMIERGIEVRGKP